MPLEQQLLATYRALLKMETLNRQLCIQLPSMLLIMEAASLFIKMKMIFTWRSHTRALWYIPQTEIGSIPVLSPLTDSIMLKKITLQIQWSPGGPLGINWVIGKGNLYILQTAMQLESSCCLSSKLDVPNQGQDPSVSKIGQTSGNHLSTRGYPDQQLVLYAHFYRLLGHCQWSGHLVCPMATTIPIQGCPFRVKSSGNLLSHRYPKYQSRSHMSFMYLMPQYKVSRGHSLSSSEFQTSLIINKTFISLLRIHNAGLANKIFNRMFTWPTKGLTSLRLQDS